MFSDNRSFGAIMSEIEQINRILYKALKMEKFGQNFFSLLEELADGEESQLLFKRLAAEEENHYKLFLAELKNNGGEYIEDNDFDPDRVFNKDIAKIIREGPVSVLTYAIQVEQRVIDFYRESIDAVFNDNVKQFLTNLIDTEETHKRILGVNLARFQPVPP